MGAKFSQNTPSSMNVQMNKKKKMAQLARFTAKKVSVPFCELTGLGRHGKIFIATGLALQHKISLCWQIYVHCDVRCGKNKTDATLLDFFFREFLQFREETCRTFVECGRNSKYRFLGATFFASCIHSLRLLSVLLVFS